MKNLGLLDAVRRPFGLALAVMLAVLATATPAWAADAAASGGGSPIYVVFWVLAFVGSVAALAFARKFFKMMMEADEGTDEMKEIAGHVRDGAWAYLWQQYKVVTIFFV
jgi:K(+)-stimulated pyrophosphate-energized sodium pump